MADKGTSNVSGKSLFWDKCYLIVLLALLASIAAAFLFFAMARQTHPTSGPAQKSEVVSFPMLEVA